ncbi:MAG: hypothetical protein M3548_20995, partial [Actinomycetota bacterium]|nr:hypothetical protein [Actinomycetota bacterium]
MTLSVRTSATVRLRRGLVGVGIAAGFALVAPGAAHADPVGCNRAPNGSGDTIVCNAGIPAGQVLTGTAGNDIVTITGGVLSGTVN